MNTAPTGDAAGREGQGTGEAFSGEVHLADQVDIGPDRILRYRLRKLTFRGGLLVEVGGPEWVPSSSRPVI